ncbi:hypothetical protein PHMEG_00024993 [Phytophthora megakarya]|uniref:Reverse transcriptase RNase H-like domain-containing protein n=1 Tax=Phytophthora megakarya TaxID=4795 RepID=A0A225VCQ8_9STRA|nr:hypothetical protein PHMEG_00024993 [Phytophthora megakarya]
MILTGRALSLLYSSPARLLSYSTSSARLSDSLVDYPRTVAPRQAKRDAERKRIGRRSRNALDVTLECTEKKEATDDDEVCLFTDASLDGYSIVVTLVHHGDDSKSVDKQSHVMVVCKSGTYAVEKEDCPIVQACTELDYILLRRKALAQCTVDRLNTDILQIFMVLLIKYKLDFHEWPYPLAVVQANLNHTPVRRNAGITLDTVSQHLERLRGSLRGFHQEVVDEKERRRLQAIVAKNGIAAKFDIGYFVLWSRIDQRLSNNKLLGHRAHVTRLKYYSDSNLNVTQEILEFVPGQGIVMVAKELTDHR